MLIAGTDKLSLSFLHGDLGLYFTCVIKTIFFMVVQKYIVLKQGASWDKEHNIIRYHHTHYTVTACVDSKPVSCPVVSCKKY